MGINGLWDAVSAAGVSSRVEHLRGKKVAIDASFWIIHCLASESNSRLGNDVYGVFFLRICYLLEKRIFPIFVFDGRSPDAKRRTHLRRKMEREKRTRNLRLLAFKALAVQMKHLAKDGNDRVFKPSSFMKSNAGISQRELRKIASEVDHAVDDTTTAGKVASLSVVENEPLPQETSLFSSDDDFEDTPMGAVADEQSSAADDAAVTSVDILTMPRSYRALKMRSRAGVDVNLTDAGAPNELDASYFENHVNSVERSNGPNRSKNMVELPVDCSINKDCYVRLPGELRYQIMQQVKDAWMYEDRVNLLQLKSSLSQFSNLQVESYLRVVEINREIENIKRVLIKDIGVKGSFKAEDGLNLEGVNKDSLTNEIFDYNSVEPKGRRKHRFLNDLSADMQPEMYSMPSGPRAVKVELPDVDDSAFLCDSEIFGDLLKRESEDDFEVLDERDGTGSSQCSAYATHRVKPVLNFCKEDEWNVVEEEAIPCKSYDDHNGKDGSERTAVKDDSKAKYHRDEDVCTADQSAISYSEQMGKSNSSSDDVDNNSDDSDPSYDPKHGELGMAPEDESSCTPLSYEGSVSESSAEFISSDSEESSGSLPDLDFDESDGTSPREDESPYAEDISLLEHDAPATDASNAASRGPGYMFSTPGVSQSTAVFVEPGGFGGPSPPTPSSSTTMYRNPSEYRDYLRMEKLFTRADRSQFRMEDWDKVPVILDLFGVPYMIAPSEAEAQCAHLNNTGLCFGVISDDSDTIAFGASRVFKNFYSGSVFEVYIADRIVSELGLAREQLALLAIICGCDYTDGVHGIGVVNALEVIKAYPTFDDLYEFRRWATSECDLTKVTEDECPVRRDYKVAHVNYRLHWSFCSDFPNREAYNLFLSPVVSNTFKPRWSAPRYDELQRFMETNSSLPSSEVSTCLSKLHNQDSFDGFILEDFVPEIHGRSSHKGRRSLKSNRKVLQDRLHAFRDFLKRRSQRASRKAGTRHRARDSRVESSVPVAFIRSKRMLQSIEGIKEYVRSRGNA